MDRYRIVISAILTAICYQYFNLGIWFSLIPLCFIRWKISHLFIWGLFGLHVPLLASLVLLEFIFWMCIVMCQLGWGGRHGLGTFAWSDGRFQRSWIEALAEESRSFQEISASLRQPGKATVMHTY